MLKDYTLRTEDDVLRTHCPLLRRAAWQAGKALDYEDRVIEAGIGFLSALRLHGEDHPDFLSLAWEAMEQALKEANLLEGRCVRCHSGFTLSGPAGPQIIGDENWFLHLHDNREGILIVEDFLRRLEGRTRKVLRLSMAGYSRLEIEREYGITLLEQGIYREIAQEEWADYCQETQPDWG